MRKLTTKAAPAIRMPTECLLKLMPTAKIRSRKIAVRLMKDPKLGRTAAWRVHQSFVTT